MNMKNVEKAVIKISRFFDLVAKTICILSVLAVFVMCIEQVICRFLLHVTVGYVDEVSRYLFILSVFVGSCLSVRDDEHFSLDLLHSMLQNKPKALAVIKIMVQVAIGIFLAFMIRSGMILAASTTTQRSSYLQMPMFIMYWLIPICGIWMMCYVILKIVRQILVLCSKDGGHKED